MISLVPFLPCARGAAESWNVRVEQAGEGNPRAREGRWEAE